MPFFQQLLTSEKIVFCAYICIVGLTLIGLVVFGIIMAKISSGRFRKSCKVISDFANESGVINDANLEQFEATCLDDKTNPVLLEGWESFKAARFGYPSEYIDKEKVLDRFDAKKFKVGVLVTSLVLFVIAVIVAVFAIIATREGNQYTLLFAIVAMIVPLIILPCYLPAKPKKKAEAAFDQTMDDLDTAVQLQNFVERQVDNSRLLDIQNRIKEVILAEQSKPIPSKKDQLARRKAAEEELAEREEEEESLDDIRAELFADDEPIVEYAAEEEEEPAPAEEPTVELEEIPAEEEPAPAEAVAEEEPVEEVAAEEVPAEEPKPKKEVKFEPFVGVLNQVIDGEYDTATLKKIANIIVLAFGKFKEPAQREALKNSIRRFIVSYKSAAAREAAEVEPAEVENEEIEVADTVEVDEDVAVADEDVDDEERKSEIAAMGGHI